MPTSRAKYQFERATTEFRTVIEPLTDSKMVPAKALQLRNILALAVFVSFVVTALLTREQMTWSHQAAFRKLIVNHTIKRAILKTLPVRFKLFKNGSYPNLRYARKGAAINCLQKPLTDPSNFDNDLVTNNASKRFAYAWYVARPAYLCSAIAALKHLKEIREAQGELIGPYAYGLFNKSCIAKNW